MALWVPFKPKMKRLSPKVKKPSLLDINPRWPKNEPENIKMEPKEEVEEDIKLKQVFCISDVDKRDLMEQLDLVAANNKHHDMISQLKKQIAEKDQKIDERDKHIAKKNKQFTEKDQQIAKQAEQITGKNWWILKQTGQIAEKGEQIAEKDLQIGKQANQIAEKDKKITERGEQIADKDKQISK